MEKYNAETTNNAARFDSSDCICCKLKTVECKATVHDATDS